MCDKNQEPWDEWTSSEKTQACKRAALKRHARAKGKARTWNNGTKIPEEHKPASGRRSSDMREQEQGKNHERWTRARIKPTSAQATCESKLKQHARQYKVQIESHELCNITSHALIYEAWAGNSITSPSLPTAKNLSYKSGSITCKVSLPLFIGSCRPMPFVKKEKAQKDAMLLKVRQRSTVTTGWKFDGPAMRVGAIILMTHVFWSWLMNIHEMDQLKDKWHNVTNRIYVGIHPYRIFKCCDLR